MRRIVVDSQDNELKWSVVKRLSEKFGFDLISTDNEFTKAFFLKGNEKLRKEYIYSFVTQDVNMMKTDEGYIFFMVWGINDEAKGLLELFKEVYADDTHWRYFIINANGNPLKTIANILNYDYGPVVSKIDLPGENYEFIP